MRKLSSETGTSVFNTLLSALGLLFQKYTGEDDVCIGIPVSTRRSADSFRTFGLMVNTLAIRLRNESESSFRKYIGSAADSFNNAISHSALPFDKIVEAVNPPRIVGINPMFQISFSWVNNINFPIDLHGVRGKRITINKGVSPFDITFYMWENGDHIEGDIEYNSDILKAETVLRLRDHFIKLVDNLARNSETPVGRISLISDEEMEMIKEVNETSAPYSCNKTMLDLFEWRAAKDPDNVALISDAGSLTYRELNDKAKKLASVLAESKVGRGDFIGVMMRRSPELIACLLAIYKRGAAYIPLNITDPDNRIQAIVGTAGIKIVITNKDNDTDLTGRCDKQFIEDLVARSETSGSQHDKVETSSDDAAYVIFTSGTTGTPKGVLVNHRAAMNLIEWVNNSFRVTKGDKLLWLTNLSFDLSVYDIFGILSSGASVRIVNEEERQDPERQLKILYEEGITFWDSAPQSLQQVSTFFGESEISGLNKSLRLVFLSGDWIPLSLPPAVKSSFPGAVVVGLGGATEATVWSNYFVVDKINPEWKSVPYGKPIQNARYYVLDEKLNHCRINQSGNLYIGGDCLAQGYFNDPALTNSKFIADP